MVVEQCSIHNVGSVDVGQETRAVQSVVSVVAVPGRNQTGAST